ncbi:glutamine cyclotransferase [Thiogranum longum]|uniref:Glutamine cyclotransferase n=1 Tax=Thiogranum longum TaxID=1537524 RepID=A0A4R1H8Q5_9GAMM|nr:glutaminyl-peptide cyclotransferase [Thiogranum longum]TCK18214.1 glutamine cyclotransferase [Thiogranum longum]
MSRFRTEGVGDCRYGLEKSRPRVVSSRNNLPFALQIILTISLCQYGSCYALSKTPFLEAHECDATASKLSGTVPDRPYEIVARYPHDQDAFTQGLTFYRGNLYESTGKYRQSSLRLLDLETGNVLKEQRLSHDLFGEGLTVLGQQLVQLTWKSGKAFLYTPDELRETGGFNINGEGWGATGYRNQLVISDGSAWLRFLDARDYHQLKRLQVKFQGNPVKGLNELETVDGLIYANIYPGDCIAQIDPRSGQVVGWINLEGLMPLSARSHSSAVTNGIAYNAETGELFVTGKLWPYIYKLKLLRRKALPDIRPHHRQAPDDAGDMITNGV